MIETNSTTIPIGQKACINCAHARAPFVDPKSLTRFVTCKAGPPSAVGVPVQDPRTGAVGLQIQAKWPVLAESEECDAWFSAHFGLGRGTLTLHPVKKD